MWTVQIYPIQNYYVYIFFTNNNDSILNYPFVLYLHTALNYYANVTMEITEYYQNA